IDLPGKQRHALVPGCVAHQCRQPKRYKVGCLDQFSPDRPSAVGGIGRLVGTTSIVVELHEPSVLDSIRLRHRDGKDDPFAYFFNAAESYFDVIAAWVRWELDDIGARGEPGRGIDLH